MFSPRLLVHSAAAGTLCAMLYWAGPVHSPKDVSDTEISEYALYDRPSSIDSIGEGRRVSTDYTVRPHRSHRVYSPHDRRERCRLMPQNAMQEAKDSAANSIERARRLVPHG